VTEYIKTSINRSLIQGCCGCNLEIESRIGGNFLQLTLLLSNEFTSSGCPLKTNDILNSTASSEPQRSALSYDSIGARISVHPCAFMHTIDAICGCVREVYLRLVSSLNKTDNEHRGCQCSTACGVMDRMVIQRDADHTGKGVSAARCH